MRRTLLAFAATVSMLGVLQAPVAEASGWFHPLRDVQHAENFVSNVKNAVLESHSMPLLIAGGVLVGLSVIAAAPVYAVMGGVALGVVYLSTHDQYGQDRLQEQSTRAFARIDARRSIPLDPIVGVGTARNRDTHGAVGVPGAAGGTTSNAGFMRR